MKSLLFLAETKVENVFYSWLEIELFFYLQTIWDIRAPNEDVTSYFNYLEERLKNLITQNNQDTNKIESVSNQIKKDDNKWRKSLIVKIIYKNYFQL